MSQARSVISLIPRSHRALPPHKRHTTLPVPRSLLLPPLTPSHLPLAQPPKQTLHPGHEAGIRPRLARIPHHDASEAAVLRAELHHGLQPTGREIPPTGTGIRRHAEQNFSIWILGALRPGIPLVEVEVPLVSGAGDVRRGAAAVVVELHVDPVERDVCGDVLVVPVRVGALGRGAEEVLLARRGVHERAQAVGKGRHVGHVGLEVEVEAVEHRGAKGPQRAAAGLHGAVHGPDLVGAGRGGVGRGEATFVVGVAADGEHDGFSLGLACLDVGSREGD